MLVASESHDFDIVSTGGVRDCGRGGRGGSWRAKSEGWWNPGGSGSDQQSEVNDRWCRG